MRKQKKWLFLWEHYITHEIGIEFKACLYFFCILVFYSVYKLIGGIYEASIPHMAEMIGIAYAMGYIQVYMLGNFDEAEHLRAKEIFSIILCTAVYAGLSYFCRWFDRNIAAGIAFAVYIVIVYLCAFLVYKCKRQIDEKRLNSDLKAFQERKRDEEHH